MIWFHTPHWPVIASDEQRARYPGHSEVDQHFYGTLTAMDEQIGRLRETLRALNVEDDTMLWFCSDNGPARRDREYDGPGLTRGLRGHKGRMYEGGVRVPGLLVWPSAIPKPREVDLPFDVILRTNLTTSRQMEDLRNVGCISARLAFGFRSLFLQ